MVCGRDRTTPFSASRASRGRGARVVGMRCGRDVRWETCIRFIIFAQSATTVSCKVRTDAHSISLSLKDTRSRPISRAMPETPAASRSYY